MGLNRKSEQKFNTPAKPAPLPLAQEVPNDLTQCPACSVALRPGAVLCVECGARLGRIDTHVDPGMPTRAPCPKCGYDMSGVNGTTCPECGGEAPFGPAKLEFMTDAEAWTERQVMWETCRAAIGASVFGLLLLVGLAAAWYGPKGVGFWLAAVVPAWVVASVGYIALGFIIRFLDTTIPITLLQVLGVTLIGLALVALFFPYTNGRVHTFRFSYGILAAAVALATMVVMDDDDRWQSLLASLPISIACLAVPALLLAAIP
ncbi:MAG: zinc ribbon domain-containing protein [Phycisphaerae bacterium]|nr:zinc ribbon domain-containing protein [Phycisphaerae bacterium]